MWSVCHATCICPYIYTSASLNLPATQTTNIVQNLNNQQTNTNTQLKHKLNTTEIGNVHRLVPISHHPLVVGLSRISEFLHCSEIGNVHMLVLTSLRVLQCQLQLPIYIHTVTCKLAGQPIQPNLPTNWKRHKPTQTYNPCINPPKYVPCHWQINSFSNMQSSHTKLCQKLVSGRGTPLLLHTAGNYLIFVRLDSPTLKKKNHRARSARAVTELRHFEVFASFVIACVMWFVGLLCWFGVVCVLSVMLYCMCQHCPSTVAVL